MKAVLFDLDGTLLHTEPDFTQAMKALLQQKNHPQPSDLTHVIRKAISQGTLAMIQAAFNFSNLDPKQETLKTHFLDLYQARNYELTDFYPGIKETLDTLEQYNIPWGIVTNKHTLPTQTILKKFDLTQRAHCIVCGDTLTKAKPHPDPVLHACAQLNITPQEAYFIGDAKQDILAGRAAGTQTAVALFGYIPDLKTAQTWPADHFLDHPNALHEQIRAVHAR